MKRNELTELRNVGTKIASRLNEVGIYSKSDLRRIGAVEAHRLIKKRDPNETLPVCYYLYSFEGALKNLHWNDLGDITKQKLKKQLSGKTCKKKVV